MGWQLPGGTLERPIPGNRLSPYVPGAAREAAKEPLAGRPAEAARLFPNPAGSQVTLTFTALASGPADVVIHNGLAREVKRLRVEAQPGPNAVRLRISELVPGVYFVSWGTAQTKKLVIER